MGLIINQYKNINDEIYQIIGNYDIGSVILFAANFDHDATVNVELIDGLQRAAMDKSLGKNAIPLLIGRDQEVRRNCLPIDRRYGTARKYGFRC